MPIVAPFRSADADVADADLVGRISRGDEAAIATLYDRYGSSCYALARRITLNDELAAEVVQDTFLALWRRPEGYQPERGKLSTWLMTITHHRAVDRVRREEPHRSRRTGLEVLDGVADAGTSVADQAVQADRAAQTRAALASLSQGQREALFLAYYGGHTQREIAGLLDLPLGTVKTRTASALTKLRELLARDEDMS